MQNLMYEHDKFLKTIYYNKAPSISSIEEIVLEHEKTNIPIYKYILFKYFKIYYEKSMKDNIAPLTLHKMKTLYGLSNNANRYFNIQPNTNESIEPKRISENNAFILIFILGIPEVFADLLLESIGVVRLTSPIASKRTKALLYCLKCKYNVEETNLFLYDNGYEVLY